MLTDALFTLGMLKFTSLMMTNGRRIAGPVWRVSSADGFDEAGIGVVQGGER